MRRFLSIVLLICFLAPAQADVVGPQVRVPFGGGGGSAGTVSTAPFQLVVSASGTDAYSGTPASPYVCPGSLATAPPVMLFTDVANTGAATFDFCGLGAKAIVLPVPTPSTALVTGDLVASDAYLIEYNATNDNWRVMSNPTSMPTIGRVNTWATTQTFTLKTLATNDNVSGGYGFSGDADTGFFRNNSGGAAYMMSDSTSHGLGVTSLGYAFLGSTTSLCWQNATFATNAGAVDTCFSRDAAANFQLGTDVNGTVADQVLKGADGITGSNIAGADLTLAPGSSTGNAVAQTNLNRNLTAASGTTQQSQQHGVTVCPSKILSNTSATTTTFATIGAASNSGGGYSVTMTIVAAQSTTAFDVETQTATASFVNLGGTMTMSTPTITASSAANNSGSATLGFTHTGASPTVSLKVTPVFTTIVPTTVTLYATIVNNGPGAVTCQ